MEQQANRPPPHPTPPKKVEDEAAQKPKRPIFLSLIGGEDLGLNMVKFSRSSLWMLLH